MHHVMPVICSLVLSWSIHCLVGPYVRVFLFQIEKGDQIPTSTYLWLRYGSVQSTMALEQEMQEFDGFSPKSADSGTASANRTEIDADRAVLLRLGKKQVLKVSSFS